MHAYWSMLKVVFLHVLLISVESRNRVRNKRQTTTCTYRGTQYLPSQQWTIEVGTKIFTCSCSVSGMPNCSWQTRISRRRRCYDRRARRYRAEGAEWVGHVGARTLDCICERNEEARMQISCSAEKRCHYKGVSYVRNDEWQSAQDVTGLVMNCRCHGNERVTCRASVTTEIPRPEVDAQWIEDHVVYGKQVLRPRITTLQACDTGTRVVSSGFTWNQTTQVGVNGYTVERCECRDALIHCELYHMSRSREPHCLTDDGEVKRVGEQWIKVHHSHENIRWICYCRAHGEKSCRDIGYCQDPTPPTNGAMVCVAAGTAGPDQTHYCKPLCAEGYDFVNRQRYYRVWEVCGQVTHHRWSGGYADDSLTLAKCRRPKNAVRGRRTLYFQTDDCKSLTTQQRNEIKLQFIRSLHRNHLCNNKCEAKWFRCGPRT